LGREKSIDAPSFEFVLIGGLKHHIRKSPFDKLRVTRVGTADGADLQITRPPDYKTSRLQDLQVSRPQV
jgi:hypothetical protein